MSHIFLSYSREDAETMRRLRDDLRGRGFKVWTDETLEPGTRSWRAAIEKALEEAACLVVLLSPDAKGSEWVERELGYTDELGKPIIPILVRGEVREAVPIELINAHWADARSDYPGALEDLVRTLHRHVAPKSPPPPVRAAPPTSKPAPASVDPAVRKAKLAEIVQALGNLREAARKAAGTNTLYSLKVGLAEATYSVPPSRIVRPAQSFDSREFGLRTGTAGVDWRSNIARRGLGGGTEGTDQGSDDKCFRLLFTLSEGDAYKDLLTGLGWQRRQLVKGITLRSAGGEPLGTWSKEFSKDDVEGVAGHALAVNESMGLSPGDITVEMKTFSLPDTGTS